MKQEKLFKVILGGAVGVVVVIVAAIFLTLLLGSLPSLREFGLGFVTSTVWNPVIGEFGGLPFLAGTLLTSFLSLGFSLPFSIAIAILLGEFFREGWFSEIVRSAIELLAGIPSVIYGFWGLFFLVPLVRYLELALGVPPYGVGVLTASIILAIMIIPYSASIAIEVIALVPRDLKEAALSLGATRYEVVRSVIIPYARSGIVGGILLALGRALGETMAVTMVIGNVNALPDSIFSPANTMASVIANEFTEATEEIYLSSLIEIGLLLFLVTAVVNAIGKYVVYVTGVERKR